jgi:hypothetical protein
VEEIDDSVLSQRYRDGGVDAFRRPVVRNPRPVYNAALPVPRNADDAEDVAPTVFVRLAETPAEYDPQHKLFRWICRMALNEALNVRRRSAAARKPSTTMPGCLTAAAGNRSSSCTSPGDRLGGGLDRDAAMIESTGSGHFPEAPVGRYLRTLRDRFEGPIVADLLRNLRVRTELAMRAKGMLMMRETGFPVKLDEVIRGRLAELRNLEKSIGRTGMLALRPRAHATQKDLRQIAMPGA